MFSSVFLTKVILLILPIMTNAGPLAYAACQAACASVAAACVGGGGWMATPAVMAAYSACQSACAASLLAPTP
jgi:hypothetical protein